MMKSKDVLVSISCITYNHAPYIRQCLDGFLMQKTNFAFEVLVHDDCSIDGTTDIIKEYEARYPDIIKPIYEDENQYQQGKPSGSVVWNFPRAKGKYLALCEGDDYWIDSFKLQKQVDFLEKNPEYGMCYTNFNILYQKSGRLLKNAAMVYPNRYPMVYKTLKDYIKAKGYVCPPSWVFRKSLINSYEVIQGACDGSYCMFSHFMNESKTYYLEDVTSVYRVLDNSASHSRNPLVDYKRRKDLLELQLTLLSKYGFDEEAKELCYLDFYKQNLLFFAENHMVDEIRNAQNLLKDLNNKDKILLYLGFSKIGSKFLKLSHFLWKQIKGY